MSGESNRKAVEKLVQWEILQATEDQKVDSKASEQVAWDIEAAVTAEEKLQIDMHEARNALQQKELNIKVMQQKAEDSLRNAQLDREDANAIIH